MSLLNICISRKLSQQKQLVRTQAPKWNDMHLGNHTYPQLDSVPSLPEQYEPRVHGPHTSWPGSAWKVPASHLVHDAMPVALAAVPALHAVSCDAPTPHACPSLHGKHCDAIHRPVRLLKLPSAQRVGATAPKGQKPPGVHSTQLLSPWAP